MKFTSLICLLLIVYSCQPIRKTYHETDIELIGYTKTFYHIKVKKGYTVKVTDRAHKVKLLSIDTFEKNIVYEYQPLFPGRVRFEVFKKEKSKEKISVIFFERPDPIIYLGGNSSKDSLPTMKLNQWGLYRLFCKNDNQIPINNTFSIREYTIKYDSTIIKVNSNLIVLRPKDYEQLLQKKEKYFELYDFKVKGPLDTLTLKDHIKVQYTTEGMGEDELECLVKEKQSIYLGTKEIAHDKKEVEVVKDPEKCQQLVVSLDGTQNYIYIFDESGKRLVSEAIYSDGPTHINISDFSGTYRLEFGGDIGDTFRFNLIVK